MMQPENYKKRATEVRRAARANLLEIRQARRARKIAVSHGYDATSAPASGEQFAPEHVADTVVESASEGSAARPQTQTPITDGAGGDALDTLDELAVKNAALSEIVNQVGLEQDGILDARTDAPGSHTLGVEGVHPIISDTDPQAADGLAEDHDSASTQDAAPDAACKDDGEQLPPASSDDWSQSELAQLPGAGPGLVWMLGQCEISTLSELAQCDASELSTQLGVVGQILDVGEWVRFAQENAA
ncbi:hypothetical protein [Yoonia algicola]|uniref:Uncharacterized protein n=1 Tax=Yoonia algicola TaxID=3137368 RepID=A0AAN0NFU5_9RHOB